VVFLSSGGAPVKGNLIITVHEGEELKDTELIGKQDPFVVFKLINNKDQKTTTKPGAGSKAKWEETFTFCVGQPEQREIAMEVINENTVKNSLIGSTGLNCLELAKTQPKKKWFPISLKGEKSGHVMLSVTFIPGVSIHVLECKDLYRTQSIGKMDPYVKIKVGVNYPKQKGQTSVCKNGDRAPKWSNERHLFFKPNEKEKKAVSPIEDPVFEVKVMNKNMTRDSVVGLVEVKWSELQKIKGHETVGWFTLGRPGDSKTTAGQVALRTTDFQLPQ